MNNNSFKSICKKDMFAGLETIFIKDNTYKCFYFGRIGITVTDELKCSYTFRNNVFNDFFYTEQELRKEKLKRLNECSL